MAYVALLLGGNRGDMFATLSGVRADIESRVGTILSQSSVVETEPWGFECEEMFSNQALIVECDMEPVALLDTLQTIEREWGRDRGAETKLKENSGARYTSRAIDIDIILYGDRVVQSERLQIPHPLMQERMFVLEPLAQVAPQMLHPVLGLTVEELKERLV